MCNASATPIPGNATCDSASPARAMRRMTAKQPTSPAASAIVADSARASMLMHVKGDRRPVNLVQEIRRQNGRGFAKMRRSGAQTQDVPRMLMDHRQIMRDEKHGKFAFRLQALDELVEPFLPRFVDTGGRFIQKQHVRITHQRKGDQESLKLPA